jgi:hypothetical protein
MLLFFVPHSSRYSQLSWSHTESDQNTVASGQVQMVNAMRLDTVDASTLLASIHPTSQHNALHHPLAYSEKSIIIITQNTKTHKKCIKYA